MDKIYAFLGLCQKAGKLVSGEFSCQETIKSKKALLVILAEDASENTAKKFKDQGSFYNVPVVVFGEKERLGFAIGKAERAILAVTDEGFKKKLFSYLEILE